MILIDPVLLVLCVSASICIGLICNFLSLISKWVPNKETRLTWGAGGRGFKSHWPHVNLVSLLGTHFDIKLRKLQINPIQILALTQRTRRTGSIKIIYYDFIYDNLLDVFSMCCYNQNAFINIGNKCYIF